MKAVPIAENVYWVGGIDWGLRNFHGYLTQRGSTYNAYLILDEKITLIDTVKHYLYDEMMERIASVVDPATIEVFVSNHVEMDHSGSLPRIWKEAKNPVILASPKGQEGLKAHYGDQLSVTPVKTGDTWSIGKRTLHFVQTPMVHWPDNMVTWSDTDRILYSNDAFGQHIAGNERFADGSRYDIVFEEAAKYYANIVLPYGSQVQKALEAAGRLAIDTIAPSHGVIWRGEDIKSIIKRYTRWSSWETDPKAVIVFDTMWNSTARIAETVMDAFTDADIPAEPVSLQNTHISDIMTKILDARYICVGSPTLNNNILPTVGAFMTYLCGLAPKKRIGLAFGSYGWGGQSIGILHDLLEKAGCTMMNPLKAKYLPTEEQLAEFKNQVQQDIDAVTLPAG